ncbi:MAG: hypothetical protein EXX96DRAFT_546859 [Benjaminiella poitrasii]|nr:MAG: hypothetical protein EXX96DRAFT_546859 [Benjaminiella poitrasii]
MDSSNYRRKTSPAHELDKDDCEYAEETWLPVIKRRRRFTMNETRILEEEYELNSSPNQERIQAIVNRICTPRKIVTTWFQNRRAKNKRRERTSKKDEEAILEDASSRNTEEAINDIFSNDCHENDDLIANEMILSENPYANMNTIDTSYPQENNAISGSNHIEFMSLSNPATNSYDQQRVIPADAELRLWLPLYDQHEDIILDNYFPHTQYLYNDDEQNFAYNHRSDLQQQQQLQENYATVNDDIIEKGRLLPYYLNELFPVSSPTFTVLNSENQFYISPLDLCFYRHCQGEEEV